MMNEQESEPRAVGPSKEKHPINEDPQVHKKDTQKTEENSPVSSPKKLDFNSPTTSPKKMEEISPLLSPQKTEENIDSPLLSPKKEKVDETTPNSSPKPKKVQKGPSRRCRHWAKGLCKLGPTCTFLHTGAAGVHVPCRHFVRTGSCSRGDLCDFKHEAPAGYGVGLYQLHPVSLPPNGYLGHPSLGGIRSDFAPQGTVLTPLFQPPLLSESIRPMVAPFGPVSLHFQAQSPIPATNNHRSARCRHWENGSCRLGKMCGFQHDPNVPQVDPKYGTKVCRHWAKGNCRMGEACGFAHKQIPAAL